MLPWLKSPGGWAELVVAVVPGELPLLFGADAQAEHGHQQRPEHRAPMRPGEEGSAVG